jgi:hypothetical protein
VREETCRYQLTGVAELWSERCLPTIRESTGFGGWSTPDCQGVPAGTATWGPDGMNGLVRLPDGSLWEQAGATVPQVWVIAGNSCVPWPNPDAETLYVYTVVPPTEFVRGAIY